MSDYFNNIFDLIPKKTSKSGSVGDFVPKKKKQKAGGVTGVSDDEFSLDEFLSPENVVKDVFELPASESTRVEGPTQMTLSEKENLRKLEEEKRIAEVGRVAKLNYENKFRHSVGQEKTLWNAAMAASQAGPGMVYSAGLQGIKGLTGSDGGADWSKIQPDFYGIRNNPTYEGQDYSLSKAIDDKWAKDNPGLANLIDFSVPLVGGIGWHKTANTIDSALDLANAARTTKGLGAFPGNVSPALATKTNLELTKELLKKSPLKNAYLLNPMAEKLNDASASYRITSKVGLDDAMQSGVVRPPKLTADELFEQSRYPGVHQYDPDNLSFSKGFADKRYLQNPDDVVFKTSKYPTAKSGEINPVTGKEVQSVGHTNTTHLFDPKTGKKISEVPLQNVDIYGATPHWFKGYQKMPKLSEPKKFKSEIDWSKWNPETPKHKVLMDDYLEIEKRTKADGTWMKNSDGTPFTGKPEQFIQQQSSFFKKAFPEGFEETYRGSSHYRPELRDAPYFTSPHLDMAAQYGDAENVFSKPLKLENKNERGLYHYYYPKSKNNIVVEGKGSDWTEINTIETKTLETLKKELISNERIIQKIKEGKVRADLHSQKRRSDALVRRIENYGKSEDPKMKELQSFANPSGKSKLLVTDEIADYIEKAGLDNAKIRDVYDPYFGDVEIIMNKPGNRLKSRLGNVGFFDMTNPNIYKSLSGAIGTGALLSQDKPTYRFGGMVEGDPEKPPKKKKKSISESFNDWWYNYDKTASGFEMGDKADDGFVYNWINNPHTAIRISEMSKPRGFAYDDNGIYMKRDEDGQSQYFPDRKAKPEKSMDDAYKEISTALQRLKTVPVFKKDASRYVSDLDYAFKKQGIIKNPVSSEFDLNRADQNTGGYYIRKNHLIKLEDESPNVIAHELTHATGMDYGQYQGQREKDMDNAANEREDWEKKYLYKELGAQFDYGNYSNENYEKFENDTRNDKGLDLRLFKRFTERIDYLNRDGFYPRMMEIRRDLNMEPGQIMTQDMLNKIKKTSAYRDLNLKYDDKNKLRLFNKVAENSKMPNITYARFGGMVPNFKY